VNRRGESYQEEEESGEGTESEEEEQEEDGKDRSGKIVFKESGVGFTPAEKQLMRELVSPPPTTLIG
jgi:hypothetical protein